MGALITEVNKEVERVGHLEKERTQGQSCGGRGFKTSAFDEVMRRVGWVWTGTLETHLSVDELPTGQLVCHAEEHMFAMIDGVFQDTEGCSSKDALHIRGYFYSPASLVIAPC